MGKQDGPARAWVPNGPAAAKKKGSMGRKNFLELVPHTDLFLPVYTPHRSSKSVTVCRKSFVLLLVPARGGQPRQWCVFPSGAGAALESPGSRWVLDSKVLPISCGGLTGAQSFQVPMGTILMDVLSGLSYAQPSSASPSAVPGLA